MEVCCSLIRKGLVMGCSQAIKCCTSPKDVRRLAVTSNFSPRAIRWLAPKYEFRDHLRSSLMLSSTSLLLSELGDAMLLAGIGSVLLKELMEECGELPALPNEGGDQRRFRSRFEGRMNKDAGANSEHGMKPERNGWFSPSKSLGGGMNESKLPKEEASLDSPMLSSDSLFCFLCLAFLKLQNQNEKSLKNL